MKLVFEIIAASFAYLLLLVVSSTFGLYAHMIALPLSVHATLLFGKWFFFYLAVYVLLGMLQHLRKHWNDPS